MEKDEVDWELNYKIVGISHAIAALVMLFIPEPGLEDGTKFHLAISDPRVLLLVTAGLASAILIPTVLVPHILRTGWKSKAGNATKPAKLIFIILASTVAVPLFGFLMWMLTSNAYYGLPFILAGAALYLNYYLKRKELEAQLTQAR